MSAEFDPIAYVAEAESLLHTITDERGSASFAKPNEWGEDIHQSALIDLFPEHVAAEMAASELLIKTYPDMPFQEVDCVAQVVAHVSRAIALLEAKGNSHPRFAMLSSEEQGAVIGAVLAGHRREPFWHLNPEAMQGPSWLQPGS